MFEGLNWTAFLVAMMIVEITPGPNMGWLASLSAQSGRRVGLKAVAGVTLGLALQMIAAAAGVSTVLASSDWLYEALRWGGIAFMIYLAWQSWVETGENSPAKSDSADNFRRGLIANLLNPKALVFYIAVVGQFADATRGSLWLQTLTLGSIHLLVSLIVHIAIVLLGARLGRHMRGLQNAMIVRAGFATSLLLVALWIAISTAR